MKLKEHFIEELIEEMDINNIDITNLPRFLGETQVDRMKKLIEYKGQDITVYDSAVKNNNNNKNKMIKVKTPAPEIPIIDEQEFYGKLLEGILDDYKLENLTPLQKWINSGKNLIEKEIDAIYDYQEKIEEYIEELQDKINIAQIELNGELKRLENLENLLEIISM